MGGEGSGRWRTTQYASVDDAAVLSIAWFRRRCLLAERTAEREGVVTLPGLGSVDWALHLEGPAPYIELTYQACREFTPIFGEVSWEAIIGRVFDKRSWETIDLSFDLLTTIPPHGGTRWWFRCRCGRRTAKLYRPRGREEFACRECHQLAYTSQRESEPDRLRRRATKIRQRLGERTVFGFPWPGAIDGEPTKPKGMRWETYHRLRSEADQLEERALELEFAAIEPGIHRFMADIRARQPAPRRVK
jgi:hypothetical protein